ncbi:acylphosphatase [Vreelandella utahensis]|uniref:acylphosphatase n=1 Tax=Vreelandella halophila TaxID=86177 RepID=UPI0009844552|nr:acylphosphatase [Halomonas utahensis]
MTETCILARVEGRVQGVSFRDNTRIQAQRLGVTGYARNQPDGSVEVLACGEENAVNQLVDWLHQGPPAASVSRVETQSSDATPPTAFTIG